VAIDRLGIFFYLPTAIRNNDNQAEN